MLWELVVTNLHVSERLMAVSDIFSSQTVEYAKLSWNVQERWTVVTLNGQEHTGRLERLVENVHASRTKETLYNKLQLFFNLRNVNVKVPWAVGQLPTLLLFWTFLRIFDRFSTVYKNRS